MEGRSSWQTIVRSDGSRLITPVLDQRANPRSAFDALPARSLAAMRTRAMRRQASGMPSSLPPQLVMTWLPIRDVASALRVSKDWDGASEPIFQAMAGRHGLRRVDPSWRYTVQYYRATLGLTLHGLDLRGMELIASAASDDVPAIQRCISEGGELEGRTISTVLDICHERLFLDG